jgi:hypothetical protein
MDELDPEEDQVDLEKLGVLPADTHMNLKVRIPPGNLYLHCKECTENHKWRFLRYRTVDSGGIEVWCDSCGKDFDSRKLLGWITTRKLTW